MATANIPLDESHELSNLIWLRLAIHFLKIYQLNNAGMTEDVVAAVDASELESIRLNEAHHLAESHILQPGKNLA